MDRNRPTVKYLPDGPRPWKWDAGHRSGEHLVLWAAVKLCQRYNPKFPVVIVGPGEKIDPSELRENIGHGYIIKEVDSHE